MIAECTLHVHQLPSRAEIEVYEDITSERDVAFAIAKQWTTPISFSVGDVNILEGYDYPLHSVLQELHNGMVALRNSDRVSMSIYVMEYPTSDTVHHALTLTATDRAADVGELCFEWCEHLPQVGTFESPYIQAIRLNQLNRSICKQVGAYQKCLKDNFPEFYPVWAVGNSPVYGMFK